MERADGAGIAAVRDGARGREADVVADGIRDVPCGADRDAVPDREGGQSLDLSIVVVESLARDVPAVGGAVDRLLAVLKSRGSLKSGSGCPDPCWRSNEERR